MHIRTLACQQSCARSRSTRATEATKGEAGCACFKGAKQIRRRRAGRGRTARRRQAGKKGRADHTRRQTSGKHGEREE